ncbi:low molecular weight protein-tyrosine-phosphatase [Burkholderia sp. AW49-1]
MVNSILVLCIGNICRSPMAEGLLKKQLPNMTIQSAGLGALVGHPADPIAVGLLAERDIDIARHRAQFINQAICMQSDLILVMDRDQKARVEQRYPYARGKVFRLGEAGDFDIFDPYGNDRDVFEACLRLIDKGVDAWARRIAALGAGRHAARNVDASGA